MVPATLTSLATIQSQPLRSSLALALASTSSVSAAKPTTSFGRAVAFDRVARMSGFSTRLIAGGPPTIALVENPDILATLSKAKTRPRLVVGFAAETNDVEAHAKAKLAKKGCDWIVANDVAQAGVMGGDDNTVAVFSQAGVERWPKLPKTEVAQRLAARIAEALS